MKEQEAFERLIAVIDSAIKNMSLFGVNETLEINKYIEKVNSSLATIETLTKTIELKNETIERLEEKLKVIASERKELKLSETTLKPKLNEKPTS